jgi:hypothetical protein
MNKTAKMRRGLEIFDDEWLRQEAAIWRTDLQVGGLCRSISTRRGTERV